MPFLSPGNVVGDQANENMTRVKVAGSVIASKVGAVLREGAAIRGDFVKGMRPGISHLRREPVYIRNPQRSLQRVVVGIADALDFVNEGEARESTIERTGRILRG